MLVLYRRQDAKRGAHPLPLHIWPLVPRLNVVPRRRRHLHHVRRLQ